MLLAQATSDSINVIGIVVIVLMGIGGVLSSVIGYLIISRLKAIENSVEPIPRIQVELEGMKVKVDQHSEQQGDFCDKQEEFGKRLMDVEKHISNTERIAVLEKAVKVAEDEILKMRPIVHEIPTLKQSIDILVRTVDGPAPHKAAP